MPLWGNSPDAITNRPKWCPDDTNSPYDVNDVYATNEGWVRRAGTPATGNGNPNADPEILVCISGLAGTNASTGIEEPTPVSVRFTTDAPTAAAAQTVRVEVAYDEAVTVSGGASLTLALHGTGAASQSLTFTATGTTANILVFENTNADFSTASAGQVISLGGGSGQPIVVGSGTFKDAISTSVDAVKVLTGVAIASQTLVAAQYNK